MNLNDAIATIKASHDPAVMLEIAACWSAKEIREEKKGRAADLNDIEISDEDRQDAALRLNLLEPMTTKFRNICKKHFEAIEAAI